MKNIEFRKGPKEKLNEEELAKREEFLRNLGFSEEWIINLYGFSPRLYDPKIIEEKIFGLKKRGFKDPLKMIKRFAGVLTHSLENIDSKIEGLKKRGFADPIKLIEKTPSILSLSLENIDNKIFGLRERGFNNPLKIIERFPSILTFSFENIDKKIKLLRKVIDLYQLPLEITPFLEQNPNFFTVKIDKIIILIRVLREYIDDPHELKTSDVHTLFRSNLENTLIAFARRPSNSKESIKNLFRRIKEIKKKKLTMDEKIDIIENELEDEKIKKRYFQAYLKNSS